MAEIQTPGRSKYASVIVSNRLPVSVSKVDGKLIYTHSSGGLARAMSSLDVDTDQQVWIGWPGIHSDDLTASERTAITRKLKTYGCYPVFLTRDQVHNFYEGYANDTLWPLFHYFQSLAVYDETYWAAYKEVNELFKKAIVRLATPTARVWVHDYHFFLLPRLLRKQMPTCLIGFFLHIPFPSFEIFRLLPNRKEILEGLLGSDMIGFHVYDYVRHFQSSVLRILGIENRHSIISLGSRTVKVEAFPIGIDYKKYKDTLKEPATIAEVAKLEQLFTGKKVILSVDRLDYSKGILQRLEAFELLLKTNPNLLQKVVMVMIAVPSRTEVDAYKELRETIERTVSRINGAYATVEWAPISYQFKNFPMEHVVALYSQADVALVTPLRDGMNLVAKEYVAAKQARDGVLILSEMAGAIDELPEALMINPNDVNSIVSALKTALTMPHHEQRRRLNAMQRRLARYDIKTWAADFVDQLEDMRETRPDSRNKQLNAKSSEEILTAYTNAKNRLIFLDYDGTLHHFVRTPNAVAAQPSKQLMTVLRRLARQKNTKVCIISGRQREVLEAWFGELPVSLAAEHGAWIKDKGEWSQEPPSFRDYKQALLPLLRQYAERTPGAQIEEKTFSLVWHYRNVATELAYVRNASLRHDLNSILGHTDVSVYSGNKIIEIKPRNINKGAAATELLALNPSDFVLVMGDDYTDEHMFEMLPEDSISIKVGPGETRARYRVVDVDQTLEFIQQLSKS